MRHTRRLVERRIDELDQEIRELETMRSKLNSLKELQCLTTEETSGGFVACEVESSSEEMSDGGWWLPLLRVAMWGLRRKRFQVAAWSTMPDEIEIDELRSLLEQGGTQLVEVLPDQEYAEEHLPGAINIPLKSLDGDAVSELDRSRPIVVYCWDELWDMSPRAAWQLEALGFQDVYDFVAGKAEWIAHRLPLEGKGPHYPLVGEAARRDVVHDAGSAPG
jgi:rhodanese-related sulfurtransferase